MSDKWSITGTRPDPILAVENLVSRIVGTEERQNYTVQHQETGEYGSVVASSPSDVGVQIAKGNIQMD